MSEQYEITTDEWKDDNPGHFWGTPMCVNCHRPMGYHFQTAEGKLFCLRYPNKPEAK